MSIIGIDLGTTNSLVAELDNTGRPRIVHNREGINLTPSVVHYQAGGKVTVGQEAKSLIGIEKDVFSEFKREMGTSTTYLSSKGELTPTDLSALVLKRLKDDFESSVGKATSAVVTVPANFRNEAREATLAAIRETGLSTDILLNEPTAAALYYANVSGLQLNGYYVVFDLGGGTLDVSVIKATGNDVEVLASEGLQALGGKNFDEKLLEIVSRKFKASTGNELNEFDFGFSKNDAEDVKKSLSNVKEKKIQLFGQGIKPTSIIVTRDEFEESISSFMAQAEFLCENVLELAALTPRDIKEIFLAGGSSRIPLVKTTMSKFFGRDALMTGNPDEVIALGAAIYAGFKADKKHLNPLQSQAVAGITFQEISPAYFGTLVRDDGKKAMGIAAMRNSIIIEKNVKIPCSKTETFYTVLDSQTSVICSITQAPTPEVDPRFVRVIWEGSIELPPGRPAGQEVKITYSYNENGTMHAEFLDVASSKKTEANIGAQRDAVQSTLDINKFIVE